VLASRLRRATVIDYPDAGHAVHWEEPARVAADIARFLPLTTPESTTVDSGVVH